jgi:hypothetical protein
MRRTLITWSAAFALLVAGFGASVVALNADLYSAHGFVGRYLEALERRDSSAALALPGVGTGNDAASVLLTDEAMGALSDVTIVSDTAGDEGRHTVVARYEIAPPPTKAEPDPASKTAMSEFVVVRDGTNFGLFPKWRFVASPITSISVTVLHAQDFEVNGLPVESKAQPDTPATYQVFAPGFYVIDHESTYTAAKAVGAAVTANDEIADVTVDVQANGEFVAEVQKHVTAYLAECATQEDVLFPTGCPFGKSPGNRPLPGAQWSMVADPVVTIVPGVEPGTWAVPKTSAMAHLVVDVQSLRDGTVSTFDEDVPFDVQYALTFEPGNKLLITAVYE